jgi:hypothetical protein
MGLAQFVSNLISFTPEKMKICKNKNKNLSKASTSVWRKIEVF